MIQLTWDCPSNNNNGKMSMLNTEVWVENNVVWYEHFRKAVANPLLMLEISAMPSRIKRATLTQEVITILRSARGGVDQTSQQLLR